MNVRSMRFNFYVTTLVFKRQLTFFKRIQNSNKPQGSMKIRQRTQVHVKFIVYMVTIR